MLGPMPVPESDVNAFDKEDVLETAGMLAAPAFTIRAFEDPPPELRVFARLLALKNEARVSARGDFSAGGVGAHLGTREQGERVGRVRGR